MLDKKKRVVEYCVEDTVLKRVELDVGKGAPLFNLAAAMSDQTEHPVEEGWDPDELHALMDVGGCELTGACDNQVRPDGDDDDVYWH